MKKIWALILCLALVFAALPAPAEEASPSAEEMAAGLISEQAAKQKDAWVLAILGSGAKNARFAEGALCFSLRGFNPELKALGSYHKAADPAAWRASAMENLSAWNLEFSLPLDKQGKIAKKTATQFLNDVKKAAGQAKNAFGQNDFTGALKDLLFCSPTDAKKVTGSSLLMTTDAFNAFILARPELFPCETPAEWAPVFYAQRAQRFVVNQGPHAVKMTWDGADLEAMITQTYDAAAYDLAAVTAAERLSRENLPVLWRAKLAETAVAMAAKKLVPHALVFDIDDLAAGKLPAEYTAYFAAYAPQGTYEQLAADYDKLPAEACEEFPKTGAITKNSRGRTVTLLVPKNGRNSYVQFKDADTGVVRGDACIAPGKNVNIKIPEGTYVVQYATGAAWYGTAKLFGATGTYTSSEPITVAKSKWKLNVGEEQAGIILHPATVADFAPEDDRSVWVKGVLEPQTPLLESYPDTLPAEAGVSPFTGLPDSGEPFTPLVMVLDNAEDAYPHWGVSQADVIFQIPNAGSGVTKLLGLFGSAYPEQAGPVRSGRASMVPVAQAFDAAFVFAGPPAAAKGDNVNLEEILKSNKMSYTHKSYNMLASDTFKERRHDMTGAAASHNLSAHIKQIHEHLAEVGASFEVRPFLFTDTPRTDGEPATNIRVLHRGEDKSSGSNSASRAVFNYDPETGLYSRTNSSGLYIDRDTGENVGFANVLVLRVGFGWEDGYVYLKNHMVGSGTLEILQNGRYVRGAWTRKSRSGRLVLADADGSELQLQRGRTFIVVTNDITDVVYTD